MTLNRARLLAAATAIAFAAPVLPVQAQTAYDINRLNQAMQICNSPMGAGVPECAKLNGQLGLGGGGGAGGLGGALGGLGGGKGGLAASLLGAAMNARSQAQPQMAAPQQGFGAPGANAAALQQAYVSCIQNAAGNPTVMQACSAIITGQQAQPAMPQYPQGQAAYPQAQQMLPSAQRSQDAAMATYSAGLNYQACVAANPSNWQACVAQMGAASNAGLLNAGVSPQQLQAAGGAVPPGYLPQGGGMAGAAAQAAPAIMGLIGGLRRK